MAVSHSEDFVGKKTKNHINGIEGFWSYAKEPLIKSIMKRIADKNGMIARRATQVAATTRYWQSQPIAGVAACCHSRLTVSRTVSWRQSFYDAKERNTASARFCRNPEGHLFCDRSEASCSWRRE